MLAAEAAVSLQHIAIKRNRAFTEDFAIRNRAQAASN